MAYKVIGYRTVRFKGQDGSDVDGINLYFTYPEDYVTGVACDKVFLSRHKFPDLEFSIGDTFMIQYNKYGKVAGIAFE